MKKYLKVLLPLIITIILSGLFIYFAKTKYNDLIQPVYSPPSYVFSIVWSIVYLIFFLTLLKTYEEKSIYRLYIIVLAMHILWNFAFFLMGYYLVGLLILVVLYFTSWIFVYFLSKIKKRYFYFNCLYLIWLMVALYLNIGVFLLN